RASHRALDVDPSISTPLRPFHTDAAASPLTPNTLTPVRVELFPFAHAFRAGSRVRLTVNGPGGAVDGWLWAFGTVPGPFDVTIAHDSAHPSSVTLPVLAPGAVALQPTLPDCASTIGQPCRRVFVVNRTTDAVDAAPGDGVCATVDG